MTTLNDKLDNENRDKMIDFIYDVIASDMSIPKKLQNIIEYLKNIEIE